MLGSVTFDIGEYSKLRLLKKLRFGIIHCPSSPPRHRVIAQHVRKVLTKGDERRHLKEKVKYGPWGTN